MIDDYRCRAPRRGWKTCHPEYRVTSEAGGTISVSINEVPNSVGGPPNSVHIRVVNCGNGRQVGDTAGWDRDEDGASKVLAKDVAVNTCFQLRLSADQLELVHDRRTGDPLMGTFHRHPVWGVARAEVRRLARRWWAWLPAAVVWSSATARTLPALDHPNDGWLAVLVHHSDEIWVGLPLVVGVLAGTSWLESAGGVRRQELAGTLLARAALLVAALVPPGIGLGVLSSTLGGEYIPKPGIETQGLAAWGSVRGVAMLVALVAGGLAVMALMALLRVVTGNTILAIALPVAAYAVAVWFLPTAVEQAFLVTSEWPWPGGQPAFWALAVSGPTLCALALVGRTSPGPLRPAT